MLMVKSANNLVVELNKLIAINRMIFVFMFFINPKILAVVIFYIQNKVIIVQK